MRAVDNKRIDNLLAIGQLLVAEATELRNDLPGNRQVTRKGLSNDDRRKLISRRYKTAFKNKN